MELLSHIFTVGDLLLRSLSIFFVVTIIIFVHEMGHYLIARWCGIEASAFSLGFGPQIVGYFLLKIPILYYLGMVGLWTVWMAW